MQLIKHKNGFFFPLYQKDILESAKIKEGEEVRATRTRNPKFHRMVFSVLNMMFENQSRYDNIDVFRQVVTIKAGYVDWITGDDGVRYPFAKSWSFDKMGETEFSELYKTICEVASKELGISIEKIENERQNYL